MNRYECTVTTIAGQTQTMETYRGQVLLIVNVASKCGFTGQYAGLETLYRRYRDKGFTVLGFPSDQFAHQEPGNESEIKAFARLLMMSPFRSLPRLRSTAAARIRSINTSKKPDRDSLAARRSSGISPSFSSIGRGRC